MHVVVVATTMHTGTVAECSFEHFVEKWFFAFRVSGIFREQRIITYLLLFIKIFFSITVDLFIKNSIFTSIRLIYIFKGVVRSKYTIVNFFLFCENMNFKKCFEQLNLLSNNVRYSLNRFSFPNICDLENISIFLHFFSDYVY